MTTTLEQHMAQLRLQDASLKGEDVLVPFPAWADWDEPSPCWVTAVLDRTAVVMPRITDDGNEPDTTRDLVNLRLITVDPAVVKTVDSSHRRALAIAAARGRYKSRDNAFGRAGKGVRDGG